MRLLPKYVATFLAFDSFGILVGEPPLLLFPWEVVSLSDAI